MDPITISALIAGGSSLLGGILGNKQSDKNAQIQMMLAQQNMAQQKEFAQKGVQWKVADALAAGINPLAALGMQSPSFSPVSVGDLGGNELGRGIADMGQNISRAMAAYKSPEERAADAENTRLELEKKQLSNDVLRMEIASKGARIKEAPPAVVSAIPLPPPDHRKEVKVQEPQYTPYQTFSGVPLLAHPGFTDAQTGEDRSGEVSDFMYGAFSLPADWSYSVDRMLSARGYKSRPYNIPDALARRAMMYDLYRTGKKPKKFFWEK